MSDKERRKKDSKDKNKENQAMHEAEENPEVKRAYAAHNPTNQPPREVPNLNRISQHKTKK
jgi:hypothetical protein